jgi:hypothetical protein
MQSVYQAFVVISWFTLTQWFKEPSRVLIFFGVVNSIEEELEFSSMLSFLAISSIPQSLFELCYFVPATFFPTILNHPFVNQCQKKGITCKILYESSVVQAGRVFSIFYMSSEPFKCFAHAQQESLLFPFKPVPKEVRFGIESHFNFLTMSF